MREPQASRRSALLVSVAFWTWLWGPMGLLLATPLTVCVVVLGKYVSGLEFLATLMSDQPTMTIDQRYYQRLLARDIVEAGDILEQSRRGRFTGSGVRRGHGPGAGVCRA